MALTISPYAGQGWTDDSTPDLCAETLNAVDAGITANSNAINAIANAVVSQILNDPNKIASMAALFAVNQTVNTINSNLNNLIDGDSWVSTTYFYYKKKGKTVYLRRNGVPTVTANTAMTLGTLPSGYRPQITVFRSISGYEQSEWMHRYFEIGADGTVKLNTSKSTNYIPPFQISFIID